MNYLMTFLEGFASFISPCILPLIPMYISYFSGNEKDNTKKAFINALMFCLGFSVIFILMSVFASTLGIFINENLNVIKAIFGVICIIFGILYMDIIKVKFFGESFNIKFDVKNLNLFRSFVFGVLFSVSHAPCTGPFLGSALMLIIKEQNILSGVLLMIAYCIGIGIPFIISALLIDKLKVAFNFIKKHYKNVKILAGILLILTGLYLIIVPVTKIVTTKNESNVENEINSIITDNDVIEDNALNDNSGDIDLANDVLTNNNDGTNEMLSSGEELVDEELADTEHVAEELVDEELVAEELVPESLDEELFDKLVINSSDKVVVDFYADWCIPCQEMSPIIDEVAKENPEIKFYRVNVDYEENLANRYRIMSIPTLILFESGEDIDINIGLISKEQLIQFIKGE